ncbi:MAG: hypothetical protein KatS3mg102_0031 [Planctomycetota bacterium]|nr:MAG: hypothetical protein KatS3mg102_0031 [Planctomycetota bacterium]
MTARLFTPREASRTLPLVRRIVADILERGRRLRALLQGGWQGREQEVEQLEQQLDALLAELEQIGCSYKDWSFDVGLVDFPAVIDGQPVYLCWRSDEPRLAWYHPVETGYAARRPIPEELLREEAAGEAGSPSR